jgi:MFS family permease
MVQPPLANKDARRTLRERFADSNIYRVFSYSDFRLLWIGAFLSFTGSQVQNIAQGYFVYRLTQDESKLGFVSFCSSFAVFLFGFLAGSLADAFDKRMVLIVTQAIFALGAFYLAVATHFQFVQYWQIATVAGLLGLVSSVEMPTRQSIVSRVVPPDVLASAVPVNALTFNVARILGPAIGAILLVYWGVATCYFLNGVSFLALIWAALAIKANLKSHPREPQPIRDLLMEGFLYTMRVKQLRTLFFLETITATCGLAYLPMMPAYVHQVMGIGANLRTKGILPANAPDPSKTVLGYCYIAVGIGAITGLLLVTQYAEGRHKAAIIRCAMWTIGVGLAVLSFVRIPWLVYPTLLFMGAASVAQLNTSNALFQLMSPERLRGRVIAMHIWAINGLSPFGVVLFGWVATQTRINHHVHFDGIRYTLPTYGVSLSMQIGGLCVILGALAATLSKRGLSNLP